uniref:Laminin subunit alpha-2 n=1 Tax=Ciona savignyi TaxID=51511 RepID=H2ZIA5_CIOSA
GLFPSVVNLASHAEITSNATCGERGPDKFCKLVQHVDRRTDRGQQCGICDQFSRNPSERHAVENAIDGRGDRWWQSPTIDQGYQYHRVTLTLDLKQVFQVAYVIIKAANSPRPGNWILEKSTDGVTWSPWQYFATSDRECLLKYGKVASQLGAPNYKTDSEVMCTTYFSRLNPFQNGEIHVSLINGRPSAENPSFELVDFTSARYIRLRLQKIRTLHGDLMTLSIGSTQNDPSVTRRYYYSIKDISIGGMCICYGHASTCPTNTQNGLFHCACEHNTVGFNCERCAPGFHQYKWMPGNNGFQCEECNCHGHATECYYDPAVNERGDSLNTRGEYIGGGVCVGCRDGTAGINCQSCVDGMYRPLDVEADSSHPCLPCNCNAYGGTRISDSGPYNCVKDIDHIDAENDLFPGSCYCKVGYTGQQCDKCAFGYTGFPYCEPCPCNTSGSLNIDPCIGDCACKEHVTGDNCNQCKVGFYNLQRNNPMGCDECFCNGATQSCVSSNLRWSTIHTNEGWEVRDQRGRRRTRPQIDPDLHEPYVEHGPTARELGTTMYYWSAPARYLGNKLNSYGGTLRYTVSYDILQGAQPMPIQANDIILDGNGRTVIYNHRGMLISPEIETEVALKLASSVFGSRDGWVNAESLQPVSKADMIAVLSNLRRILIRAVYSRNIGAVYRIHDVYMDSATPEGKGLPASSVEICHCPPGYTGYSCQDCATGYWRNGEQCFPCNCNHHSNICNKLNGACENCQHSTIGIHCERCKPGYYGNALNGTSEDCQRCSCPLATTSNNFSPTCLTKQPGDMMCLECAVGNSGKRCETCSDGYFGNPFAPGGSCQPCSCNGNSGACNQLNGVCKFCKGHTAGDHCERCEAAYYGDAILRKNCGPCECNPIGSLSRQCDFVTGQCPCRQDVYGRKCDACASNNYLSIEEKMCVPCDCNPIGSIMMQCRSDGSCVCRTGVVGKTCGICSTGYHSFGDGGCIECDCTHTNGHCNPATGECVCPANTHGEGCMNCVDGSYQWSLNNGCTLCNCSKAGSTSFTCDNITGQCPCKFEYTDKTCNRCRPGYYGYPNCKACNCLVDGTQASTCLNDGTCECSDDGQCLCKANVQGLHCDRCVAGAFGLSNENEVGCTTCFCSRFLLQFAKARQSFETISLSLAPVEVTNEIASRSTVGVADDIALLDSNTAVRAMRSGPYYWRLPPQFNGDRRLSYGGKLRYTIYFVSEFSTPPGMRPEASVIIQGGNLQTIKYSMEDPHIKQTRAYVVPMQEFGWAHLDSNKNVTRDEFSLILQNVNSILIKASYGFLMDQSRLSEVYLDVAVAGVTGRGDSATDLPPAYGIEECICPPGYSGLSCQNCMAGYMRVQREPNLGMCELCNCFNRSDSCDIFTGKCLNCIDKFVGHNCETCETGYYFSGNSCHKCECPGAGAINNFSPTCHSDGSDGIASYTCDACQIGYEGKHCERCADGYFGDPTVPGGFCAKCGCNVAGSLDGACDKVTGQCNCDEGIKGRICDRCSDKHVITTEGCRECNDECAGKLLLEIEEMVNRTNDVDIRDMFPPPWNRLIGARNVTAQLQKILENSSNSVMDALADMVKIPGNITKTEMKVYPVVAQAKSCITVSSNASGKVNATREHVKQQILQTAELNNTVETVSNMATRLLHGLQNGTAQDAADIYSKVDIKMNEMRARNINQYKEMADTELEFAKDMLELVYTNFTARANQTEPQAHLFNEELIKQVGEIETKFRHLQMELSNASTDIRVATTKNRINNMATMTNVTLDEAQKIVNAAIDLYKSGLQNMEVSVKSQHFINELKAYASSTQAEVEAVTLHNNNILGSDLQGLQMSSVKSAVEHSAQLQEDARMMLEVYKNVSAFSYNQTEAASRWTNIIRLLVRANKTSKTAIKQGKAALSTATTDLGIRANESLLRNMAILNEVAELRNTVNDLLRSLEDHLRSSNHSALNLTDQHNRLLSRIDKINAAPSLTSNELFTITRSSNKVLGEINKQLEGAQENVRLLGETELQVLQQGMRSVSEAKERTTSKLERVQLASESVRANISNIRQLIEDARRKAGSIRVSVSSKGKCAMAYKPTITPGKTTEIVLTIQNSEPNNALLYLARPRQDYIVVELRDYKVTVTWDLGGGPGFVQNPLIIKADTENLRSSPDWFKIIINRRNQELNVTAYRESDKIATMTNVGGVSPGSYSMLDINNDDILFVGGILNTTEVHEAVMYRTFNGCMGEAFLQGRTVGLWNFREINNPEDCKGCIEIEVATDKEQTNLYSYYGRSYSVLRFNNHDSKRTQISIRLQSFSSEGLIVYTGSATHPDFYSIELNKGRIMLKLDLGNGVHNASTENQYNTGEWVQVTFRRFAGNSLLSIKTVNQSQENIWLRIQGSDESLNFTSGDVTCVGGFPSDRTIKADVTKISFVGCLKEFSQNNLLRSLKSTVVEDVARDSGVQTACPAEITRDIGISNKGFVELKPINLQPTSSISITFNTRNEDAVLLFATSDNRQLRRRRRQTDEAYYSMYVYDGFVHTALKLPGSPHIRLTSKFNIYNDGRDHTATLHRRRENITLQMNEDGDYVSEYLPRGADQTITVRRVFVGGIPAEFNSTKAVGTEKSLNGCVRDLMSNLLVNFKEAVQAKNSYFGTCAFVEFEPQPTLTSATPPNTFTSNSMNPPKPPRATTPNTQPPLSAGRMPVIGNFSAHFGLSRNSHVTFKLKKNIAKKFTFDLKVRTLGRNGILVYAGHKTQVDFFALKVKEGIPIFQFDNGRGRGEADGSIRINDGKWHRVDTLKKIKEKRIHIRGWCKNKKTTSPKGANIMGVDNILYVGGLPESFNSKKIGQLSSMDACIKDLVLNRKRKLNLSKPRSAHKVDQCYKKMESGAFFNGKGYAIYSEKYRVGPRMLIEMEFRTWNPSGILLSINNRRSDGLGIELVNGSIYFRTDNGAGPFEAVYSDASTQHNTGRKVKFNLCDGRWHSLIANKDMNSLSLVVDGNAVPTVVSRATTNSADTKDPLYVGGIPDGTTNQQQVRTNQNLQGCIRNVRLKTTQVVRFDEIHESVGVYPNSCPKRNK